MPGLITYCSLSKWVLESRPITTASKMPFLCVHSEFGGRASLGHVHSLERKMQCRLCHEESTFLLWRDGEWPRLQCSDCLRTERECRGTHEGNVGVRTWWWLQMATKRAQETVPVAGAKRGSFSIRTACTACVLCYLLQAGTWQPTEVCRPQMVPTWAHSQIERAWLPPLPHNWGHAASEEQSPWQDSLRVTDWQQLSRSNSRKERKGRLLFKMKLEYNSWGGCKLSQYT